MGRIKKQVMARTLTEARALARTWPVGGKIFGEKITKVAVKLATTGRRPYDVIVTTPKGTIDRHVMAYNLADARASAKTWPVGGRMFGEKITKVTVRLSKTRRRPYDVIITTKKRKK